MTSAPRCRTRMSRIAHSVGVSRRSSPCRLTFLAARSMVKAAVWTTVSSAPCGVGVVRAGALGGAAHRGAHPGEELGDAEGFGDVVVGAGVERVDLVRGVGARGQHDDGHGGLLAQRGDDRGAVDVGQSEVEDDQVGPIGGGGRDGVAAGVGGGHGVAVGGEVDPQGPQDVGVVVDDEHVGHRAGSSAAASVRVDGGSRRVDRQGDHHGEAPAGGRLGAQGAAHRFGEPAGHGEAQADTAGGVAVAASLERREHRLGPARRGGRGRGR